LLDDLSEPAILQRDVVILIALSAELQMQRVATKADVPIL
jgi:hypothetical protein